jgi:integrase
VAEWFKAPVLKTGRGLCSLVSSNLTPSAKTAFAFVRQRAKSPCQMGTSRARVGLPSFAPDRPYPQLSCGYSRGYQLGGRFDHRSRTMPLIGKLNALKVAREKRPGLYGDGGGLYLQVGERGTKSWVFRYWVALRDPTTGALIRDPTTNKVKGKGREMGLGSLITVSLAEARDRALECRKLRERDIDPIDARTAAKRDAALAQACSLKFKEAAEAYIAAHRVAWKNDKHAAQWPATLIRYAYPLIGNLPLPLIDTTLVMKVLEPIWSEKPETASRLRGRIESVLDWATVRGYRTGDNPARWRGHLDKLLPARSKVRKTKHHSALPYPELPAFLVKLREQDGIAARALEFTVLTAARTGETIGAKRSEIDKKNKVWTVPAERMKAGKEHRVPLSGRALQILEDVSASDHDKDDFLFPGRSIGEPLSNMAMLTVLRRMGHGGLTVHGFRSTFRDWAAEQTKFTNEVLEIALAHTIGNKTEASYRRGDLFEKRRALMEAWSRYCERPISEGSVVPLRFR